MLTKIYMLVSFYLLENKALLDSVRP